MKQIIILFFFIIPNFMFGQNAVNNDVVKLSRESCVKIISKQGNSSGTGFYIANDLIVTCLHVIANISIDSNKNINSNIFNDLKAINESGDTLSLVCISIPTNLSPEPLFQDFAILKTNKIVTNKSILSLEANLNHNVLDFVLFTGYPLGTPTMVTHTGGISGITKDKSIICVQASTNKGNSGGALINKEGKVIGIISMREGGISLGLQNYRNQISETEKYGGVMLMGVDPLQVTKETISVLDTYISTGIGYAISINFLNSYILKHKIKF